MNKSIVLYTTILITIVLSGCTNKEKISNLKKLDSVINQLDSVSDIVNSIDKKKAAEYYEIYNENSVYLKENIDEIKTDCTFQYICIFESVRKPLKITNNEYDNTHKAIDECLKQMETLKSDVKNNYINNSDFNKFYAVENEYNSLAYKNGMKLLIARNAMTKFDTIYPIIHKIIESHKKSKQKK